MCLLDRINFTRSTLFTRHSPALWNFACLCYDDDGGGGDGGGDDNLVCDGYCKELPSIKAIFNFIF